MIISDFKKRIFSIINHKSFNEIALDIFRYQFKRNKVYKRYVELLNINPDKVNAISKIPFLPIEFFKTHKVICDDKNPEAIFSSSGTTGSTLSRHYISDLGLYEQSLTEDFRFFYGDPQQYVFLALLPSYLERKDSSLVYMMNKLIELSGHPESGFYLDFTDELFLKINALEKAKKKYILFGVTYALLDMAEEAQKRKLPPLRYGIIMETGGMKGTRKELVKEEIHELLKKSFGVNAIHSEYGMTELLSQAYSKGNGIFSCPPWMQVLIRNTNDPFEIQEENKTGGINIIDLANINSCSFIATQDLGKLHPQNTFEVLGRFDNSDLRGCNLLVGE